MDRLCWQCWGPLEKSRGCFGHPVPATIAKASNPPWALLKKWSCPQASSLPHQGLSLTLWCQKSQLKFSELARGPVPCLHPTLCRTPAECLHTCSKPCFPRVQLPEHIQILGWGPEWGLGYGYEVQQTPVLFPTSTPLWLSLYLCKSSLKCLPDCLNLLLPASASSAPMRSACCWFRLFSAYF